jgi:hypothetical protein
MRRTSAGEISFPHFGHTASSDARLFLLFCFFFGWFRFDFGEHSKSKQLLAYNLIDKT